MIWVFTFLSVVLLGFLIYLHHKSVSESPIKSFYCPALLIKLAAGIILGVVYFQYYQSGETVYYHQQASQLFESALENPANYINSLIEDEKSQDHFQGSTRSNLLIHIIVFFYFITGKSYWVCSLYFSFLSFTSFWWLSTILVHKFPYYRIQVGLAFLWFPTVIFWSSGVTKDSISATCIVLLSALSLGQILNLKWKHNRYILAIPCLIILWILKYYYFIVLIPILLTGILYYKIQFPKPIKLAIVIASLITMITVGGLFHPNLKLNKLARVIYESNQAYSNISSSDNLINFDGLEPNLTSIVKNYPLAVWFGLSLPLLDFSSNFLKTIVSLENLLVILLLISCVPNILKVRTSKHAFLIIIVIVYVIILSGSLTLSSPNLGTLSRYKVSFLPFLIFICSIDNVLINRFLKVFNLKN